MSATAGGSGDNTHPLRDVWNLWYQTVPSQTEIAAKGYAAASAAATRNVAPIKSIEELWSAFNAMPPPAVLPNGDTLCLMRADRKPEFEAFPAGGRLIIQELPEMADKLVERMIIAVLGQQTELHMRKAEKQGDNAPAYDLCSAVRIARRKKKAEDNVRVEVWITDKNYGKELENYFTEELKEDRVEVKFDSSGF